MIRDGARLRGMEWSNRLRDDLDYGHHAGILVHEDVAVEDCQHNIIGTKGQLVVLAIDTTVVAYFTTRVNTQSILALECIARYANSDATIPAGGMKSQFLLHDSAI